MKRFLLSAVAVTIASFPARADDPDTSTLKVGRQADGRIVVPTNQILSPAGEQVTFPGRPVDLAWADGGNTLVVKNMNNLVFLDAKTRAVEQTLPSPVGFSVVGLISDKIRVIASDAKDHLRLAVRGTDGKYVWSKPIELPKPKTGSAHPAGLAWAGIDSIWVTTTRTNAVHLVDLKTGKATQTIPVGVAPYAVVPVGEDKVYVSNWGGDLPKAGDRTAPSSGTQTHVDERGVADRGTVSVLTRKDGTWSVTKSIRVGLHPSGMTATKEFGHGKRHLFVANANSDTRVGDPTPRRTRWSRPSIAGRKAGSRSAAAATPSP